MLLRLVGLKKSFGGVSALDGVCLKLEEAGIVGIIGPNGSGKTTLLDVISGYVRPDAGSCFLGEKRITGLPPDKVARLGIGRTFQNVRLIRGVSVLDNVLLWRPNQRGEHLLWALSGVGIAAQERGNRETALSLLERVGLQAHAAVSATALSYGQQKLLTVACCLGLEADVLLLDEPMAGVDPEMTHRLLSLIGDLRDEQKLILFVEHDLAAVRQLARTVVVMDQGQIVAQGTTEDVLARPEIVELYLGGPRATNP